MNDAKLHGHWDMKLYGPDGKVKEHVYGKNVITNSGKVGLAAYLASSVVYPFTHIAIGTSSTPESSSDTALGTEAARVGATASYTTGQTFSVYATFGAGVGTGGIVEYGIFNTSTAGTMFSRDTEAVINKSASDTLVVVSEISLS